MRYKKIKLSVWLLFGSAILFAQQTVTTTGGDAVGSGGSVAYTLGQVSYTSDTGSSGTVAQGVQQAYEVYTLGSVDFKVDASFSVYPNPTTDQLIFQYDDTKDEKLSYTLYDVNGKILKTKNIHAEKTSIDMLNFPSAVYFLSIINQENQKIQTFKIIKK